MNELLTLSADDWSLTISAGHLQKKQNQLKKTLEQRYTDSKAVSIIQLSAREQISVETGCGLSVTTESQSVSVSEPLFFENTLYDFEFCFPDYSATAPAPEIRHNLNQINEAFQFNRRHGLSILRGTIQTRNNVGWFRLPFRYYRNGKLREQALSFEVLPTKMDMQHDLAQIQRVIDEEYPLWRFSVAQTTEQTFDQVRKPHPPFPLLWLAQFESLQQDLLKNISIILASPHSRLLPEQRHLKAEQIKGRLHHRLETKIHADLLAKQYEKRYEVTRRKLSVDTPENRFIRMVLQHSSSQLERFYQLTKKLDQKKEHSRLSGAFFDKITCRKQAIDRKLQHPLFKEIGEFHGLNGESLVLQQRTGYAAVYRIWQQLKLYLDVLGRQSSISVKTVAELYEIWCFLEIRRILKEELHFTEITRIRKQLSRNGAEMKIQDGMRASFEFRRKDNTCIRLAHEPVFKTDSSPVRGWLTQQKPDIVLEVTFPDKQQLMWVFDAKYRLDDEQDQDVVPEDALHQMHRYRDAIIHMKTQKNRLEHPEKSRPVFGAFALFPGYFPNQTTENQQQNFYSGAIHNIAIGAFPLLPGEGNSGWLQAFLTEKLAVTDPQAYPSAIPDRYFVEEAARIPYRGMQQLRYSDLTLVASGAEDDRMTGYYDQFVQGFARYFHMQLAASENQDIAENIMREIRYCVIASRSGTDPERIAKWIWPVISTELCKRNELKEEISGKTTTPDDTRLFWLFTLGAPIRLQQTITGFTRGRHCMALTRLSDLNQIHTFSGIKAVYPFTALSPV